MSSVLDETAPVRFEGWLGVTTRAADGLQAALRDLLDALPGKPARPVQIAKALRVDRTLASKIRRAARDVSPLGLPGVLPGRPGMDQFFRCAAQSGVTRDLIDRVQEAYETYRSAVGGFRNQQELVTAISSADPALRRTADLRCRAAHHRACVDFFGGYAEVISIVQIACPNASDRSFGDGAVMVGYIGLRRLRQMQPLVFESEGAGAQASNVYRTLDGRPLDVSRRETVIGELCSKPVPQSEIIEAGGRLIHVYRGQGLAANEPIDIVTGYRVDKVLRNRVAGQAGHEEFSYTVTTPARLLVWDVFVHRDMWPGCVPELKIFRNSFRMSGLTTLDRWFDEVSHFQSVTCLGSGGPIAYEPQCPQHQRLVEYALRQTGWPREEFTAYRCCWPYPVMEREKVLLFRWEHGTT